MKSFKKFRMILLMIFSSLLSIKNVFSSELTVKIVGSVVVIIKIQNKKIGGEGLSK
ncbi:Uncharacterised protein [Yersinia pseudotuberculosis]|uniref:Uncharacterized protein n=1 Tax=Yersinia pseudotuberculosis serotype O:1b (strain IP 31758) TaxID=349747 RepID=A0A0U1QWI8_YERP3|nr:hypothetical protein YpsIP31758_2498 [Yersinia pseudotuberculosis IP 31758]AJK16902.1 hypothetical protein BZ19_931 [Yersinia pseudotuberculosis str. PA3606]KGA67813.1 hypothetical protein DJ55_4137 [Yersinia pseudotuberculosis]UFA62191.1 Uncharacterized protein YP598_2573 [Yersinia pseudotuberculosis]CFU89691.1 Uncharacterised protein [Yersinia pseudotuberculosis]